MTWVAERPVVQATASDGAKSLTANFTPGIGADRAVRLSDVVASAPGAAKLLEVYPYGVLKPALASLAFAGDVAQDLPSGLMHAEDPDLAGQIGAPFLSRYRLRFDFPAAALLAPAVGGQASAERPLRSDLEASPHFVILRSRADATRRPETNSPPRTAAWDLGSAFSGRRMPRRKLSGNASARPLERPAPAGATQRALVHEKGPRRFAEALIRTLWKPA